MLFYDIKYQPQKRIGISVDEACEKADELQRMELEKNQQEQIYEHTDIWKNKMF